MNQNLPVVDVYVAEMPSEGELMPLSCALRQEDIAGISAPRLRRQKYFVWKLLEYALERSFGLKMRDLTFRKEGDRYVCDKAFFSLSHSGHGLAVAVSRDPVGVDLEKVTVRDTDCLAQRVFTPEEMNIYTMLPKEEKADFFFRTWTGKEALFKAAGQDTFIPAEQNTLQETVKNYAIVVGGENFYLSVAAKTPEQIRLYENIVL